MEKDTVDKLQAYRRGKMKLTDEQRKVGIKYNIMQLLSTDIRNKKI